MYLSVPNAFGFGGLMLLDESCDIKPAFQYSDIQRHTVLHFCQITFPLCITDYKAEITNPGNSNLKERS